MDLIRLLNEALGDCSDVTVSKVSGIERTRVNRIRNGKFKISFEELSAITNAFKFDRETSQKLYDAYLYEKIGKDKYNSRLLAKEFLSSMRFASKDETIFSENSNGLKFNVDFNFEGENLTLESLLSVRRVSSMIMSQAAADGSKIRLITSPFNANFLSRVFMLTASYPKAEIDHIFSLSATNEHPEPSTYYMEVAKVVYPIFMMNTNYNAYYSLVGHTSNGLMPYHVITDKFSMLVSADSENAIVTKNADVIKLQKKLFDESKKKCSSFINKINTTEEFLSHYCSLVERTSIVNPDTIFYSIDYEPCVLLYMGDEELKKCVAHVSGDKELSTLLERFITKLYPDFAEDTHISFFTKDGVRSFVETGTIAEVPEVFGLVATPERRKEILIKVLENIKINNKSKQYFLINEQEFDPPLGLRSLGSGTRNDHLFVISNKKDGLRSILSITNQEVLSCVFEFIRSLPETNMVYPREETVAYLEKVISSL